jgi:probable HAF family extracellular repeat protein
MAAFVAGPLSAETGARFSVVDLGTPPGSTATGISDARHVTGLYFNSNGERRGFLWRNGLMTDIGTLGGIAQAFAVNDAGVVVGYSVDGQGRQRAIRFQSGGTIQDLGTLQGGIHAAANDVSNHGWIVGMSERRFGNDEFQRAALWRNGTVLDLGTFGGEFSEANGVNDASQVVGWAWYPLPQRLQRAFLWSDATGMIDLGTLGGNVSTAADVNDQGAVVGSSQVLPAQSTSHAFLWTTGTGMVDLGTPPGTTDSYATAINNVGQIVGNSVGFDGTGFVFQPLLCEKGSAYILNELIAPGSGWILVEARGINDLGQIAAIARHAVGGYRAVLLVPQRRGQVPLFGVER